MRVLWERLGVLAPTVVFHYGKILLRSSNKQVNHAAELILRRECLKVREHHDSHRDSCLPVFPKTVQKRRSQASASVRRKRPIRRRCWR